MRYHAVKQCPECGWGYDPEYLFCRVSYECCPWCGLLGHTLDWPNAAMTKNRRWWAPWTWMRPRFALPARATAEAGEGKHGE